MRRAGSWISRASTSCEQRGLFITACSRSSGRSARPRPSMPAAFCATRTTRTTSPRTPWATRRGRPAFTSSTVE
eukprot:11174016-Lingulodinium_polyedra.AAC.1